MRKRVIIAGAGVSMAPPSNLPSWWEYNKKLISEIKKQAKSYCPQSTHLLDLIDIEKNLPVQCISDLIVTQGAGDSYFPLLQQLNCSTPNLNHFAMADLAKMGALAAIITTNFDQLIETAFQQTAVPLAEIITEEKYLKSPIIHTCKLFKIHGSVTNVETLIDTISQKAVGLSITKRQTLCGILNDCDIIVMGFSGADLDFDLDYIPFASAIESGSTITWIVRPGTKVGDSVSRLKSQYEERFNLVETELSSFFKDLGVNYEELSSTMTTQYSDSFQVQCDHSLNEQINRLFDSPHIGGAGCIGFCISLLDMIGESEAALELAELYESMIDLFHLKFSSPLALNALAIQKMKSNKLDDAKKWFKADIRCLEEIQKIYEMIPDINSRENKEQRTKQYCEYLHNLTTCYTNLGAVYLREKDADSALKYLQLAKIMAESTDDIKALSTISFIYSNVRYIKSENIDNYLIDLRRSEQLAVKAGNIQTLAEILINECNTRLLCGEYYIAQKQIDLLETELRNVGQFELQLHFIRLKAELLARKGENDRSIEFLCQKLSDNKYKLSSKNAAFFVSFIFNIFFYDDRTAELIRLLSPICSIETKAVLQNYEEYSEEQKMEGLDVPAAIIAAQPDSNIRKAIIVSEYLRQKSNLYGFFEELCIEYVNKQNWERVKDLSTCMLESAEEQYNKSVAYYYLGCSKLESGDYCEAKEFYEKVIQAKKEVPPNYLRWSYIELAKLALLQGANSLALYSEAIKITKGVSVSEQLSSCMAYISELMKLRCWDNAVICLDQLLQFNIFAEDDCEQIRLRKNYIMQEKRKEKGLIKIDLVNDPPEVIATEALRLFTIDKSHLNDAWTLIRMAQKKYALDNNRSGVGKCENNMGIFCLSVGNDKEALEHFNMSFEIKKETNDISGIISQLISIIILLLSQSPPQFDSVVSYVNYAETHIIFYENNEERYLLYYSLFLYYSLVGNPAVATYYAKLASKGINYVAQPDRSALQDILNKYILSTEKYFNQ